MLPQFYKFVVVNNSGQTITFNNNGRYNLKMTAWIVDPATGKITYTPLADDDLGFIAADATVNGGEDLSSEINNTVNKYLGLQIQLEVTHDEGLAADGRFEIFLAGGDASGELPTDATGYASAEANNLRHIGGLTWEPNAADDDVQRSPVYNL